jgi:hypothetical protein
LPAVQPIRESFQHRLTASKGGGETPVMAVASSQVSGSPDRIAAFIATISAGKRTESTRHVQTSQRNCRR